MMTDHLLRKYAPIPAKGWQQIDDEAEEDAGVMARSVSECASSR